MHSRIKAERKAAVHDRLVSAAEALSDKQQEEYEKFSAVVSSHERDPEVKAIKEQEALADLLESLATTPETAPVPKRQASKQSKER